MINDKIQDIQEVIQELKEQEEQEEAYNNLCKELGLEYEEDIFNCIKNILHEKLYDEEDKYNILISSLHDWYTAYEEYY